MDSSQKDELRSLRERAYGPHADIHEDPAAVARLTQLEQRDQSPQLDDHAPEVSSDELASPTPVEAPEPVTGEQQKQRARPRFRTFALWVGSLGVAIAATAFITKATVHATHTDPQNVGATQVAALSEDVFWTVPPFMATTTDGRSLGFEEFYGMRVITGTGIWSTPANDDCIFVMTSADAEANANSTNGYSFGSQMYWGCAANSFPAAVAFKVSTDSPEPLREEFPDGTALQFVFEKAGGDVVVFMADAE